MSKNTKSDLLKVNKQLKNQVAQLQRKVSTMKVTTSQKKKTSVPVSSIPTWSGQGKSLRIHQTERIGTIVSHATAGTYTAGGYGLNPANSSTFPWLSNIAKLFDKYKFHYLKFIYINNSPTSMAGNVTMGVDFDVTDATPANGTAMTNLSKFCSFAPWKQEELVIPVNRPGNNQWLYTIYGDIPTGTDAKTYYLGKFFVSSEGIESSSKTLGYLCVEYDVELLDKTPN